MKLREKLIIYATVALLFLPATLSCLQPDLRVSERENRKVAGFPPIPSSMQELIRWPLKCDAFLKDHFFMRSTVIHHASKFLQSQLSLSINRNVILGKENWLYISKGNHAIEKYQGIYTFRDERQKQDWIFKLNKIAAQIKEYNADVVFVIIPSKPTVYPEYLPEKYKPVGPTLTDTVVELLRENAKFHWIDLRPVLIRAGRTEKLFFEHDTHWNARGSYLAYLEVMKEVQKDHAVRILDPSELIFASRQKVGGDLALMLGLNEEYSEIVPMEKIIKSNVISKTDVDFREDLVAVETSQPELSKAIILCDSFVITYMAQYLQESFSCSSFKHHDSLSFDTAIVGQVKPDIVLIMITERLIPVEINLD